MPVILAIDAAWARTGWAVCDQNGPIAYGDAVPDGTWRYARARELVRELRERANLAAIEADADPPRLVVERCGAHYSWKGREDRGGAGKGRDPTLTVRGLSEIVGAMALSGTWPGWAYPWLIEPNDWRSWWRLRGARVQVKTGARVVVSSLWPDVGAVLAARAEATGDDEEGGDVAEAILLGVGAARRPTEAPAGPSRPVKTVANVWGTR